MSLDIKRTRMFVETPQRIYELLALSFSSATSDLGGPSIVEIEVDKSDKKLIKRLAREGNVNRYGILFAGEHKLIFEAFVTEPERTAFGDSVTFKCHISSEVNWL